VHAGLFHVGEEAQEGALLYLLQLALHLGHVGGEGDVGAVVEEHPVVGIALDQLEMVLDVDAQIVEGLLVGLRHQVETRALVESKSLGRVDERASATAECVLLEHGHAVAVLLGQTSCRGHAAHASADDHHVPAAIFHTTGCRG
jgi:hypothetical protein